LAAELQNDAVFAEAFNRQFGTNVSEHMQSGKGLLNPPVTNWHYPIDNPGDEQLLTRDEHSSPLLQSLLHPNQIGGFSLNH
jgi:hypothetical protein